MTTGTGGPKSGRAPAVPGGISAGAGWGSGLIGILIFSGTLPATRMAVAGLSPLFLTSGRAVVAAVLGAVLLLMRRQSWPARDDLNRLAIVAIGCVAGFPLLTSLALQHITAARSVVFTGLLPLATAAFGAIRAGERPQPAFWLFSGLGASAVATFALSRSNNGSATGDLLMVVAVIVCGLGYAEGATLSRRLGGWQVISWALLISLLPMLVIALASRPAAWGEVGRSAWIGFGYVSVFSMLLGFIFWYRGLALGGIAAVGQLQLVQPFLSLLLAAILLREPIEWQAIVAVLFVVLCIAGARRVI